MGLQSGRPGQRAAVALLGAAVAAGCVMQTGKEEADERKAEERARMFAVVSQVVGPQGGTLSHPSGADLVVPPGALKQNTELTMRGIPAPAVAGAEAAGQGYELEPVKQLFLLPARLMVPYDFENLPWTTDPSELRVFLQTESDSPAYLESQRASGEDRLAARTLRFGQVWAARPTTDVPIVIETVAPLPAGAIAKPYGPLTLLASGGAPPYGWSLTAGALPAGLALSELGIIQGVPQANGSFAFMLRVRDKQGLATEKPYTMVVHAPQSNPAPIASALVPAQLAVGSPASTVSVQGQNFAHSSQVLLDNQLVTSELVTVNELSVEIPASYLTTPGTRSITVYNPPPGGGISSPLTLTVVPAQPNPIPTVALLVPDQIAVQSPDTVIEVRGTNFVTTSTVMLGTATAATTFESDTRLRATVPAAMLKEAGQIRVGVFTPPPGGGHSGTLPLRITGP